jgi:glutamate synthase (NADPH/NADH) large chain
VGICTQDPKLREFFGGSADKVVNLMTLLAEDVREYLAALGFERLSDIIGRSDLLYQSNQGDPRLDALDLNSVLTRVDANTQPVINEAGSRNPVSDTLDQAILQDASPLLERGEALDLSCPVANTQRTVGARLSSLITQRFGMTGLPENQLTLHLYGSAGQSFGAFAIQGMKLVLYGDTNDYTGKGLSGGTLVVRPPKGSGLATQNNTIIGNTVLYGATGGKLYAAGQAGERFAVRNSGADVVIEGCGANGCEYMTGGTAVILGDFGYNLAAGMTGGMAYVYDPENMLPARINDTHVLYQDIQVQYYEDALYELIGAHVRETGSSFGQYLLDHWQASKEHFRQIIPREQANTLATSTAHDSNLQPAAYQVVPGKPG